MNDPRNTLSHRQQSQTDDPLGKSKSDAGSILPGEIRRANELELIAICVALRARYHQDDYILDRANYLTRDEIMIREDYISDGPSFCGKVAGIFWGEACCLTVLGDNGTTDTNWEVIDVEV